MDGYGSGACTVLGRWRANSRPDELFSGGSCPFAPPGAPACSNKIRRFSPGHWALNQANSVRVCRNAPHNGDEERFAPLAVCNSIVTAWFR